MAQEAKKSKKSEKRKVAFFRRGVVERSWARTQKVVRPKNSPGKAPNHQIGQLWLLPNVAAGEVGRESTGTAHAVGPAGKSRLMECAGACEKIRRAGLSTGPREVAWRARAAFSTLGAPTRGRRPQSRPMWPRAAPTGSRASLCLWCTWSSAVDLSARTGRQRWAAPAHTPSECLAAHLLGGDGGWLRMECTRGWNLGSENVGTHQSDIIRTSAHFSALAVVGGCPHLGLHARR